MSQLLKASSQKEQLSVELWRTGVARTVDLLLVEGYCRPFV